MKILMVRMWPYELDINNYNCQETGLAKALISKGHTCDIVLYTDGAPHTDTIGTDVGKPITIYYLNAKNILKNAFYGSALYKLIDDYDIIQASEYDQIANTKLLKKAKGKMVIYHGPYKSEFTKGYKIKCIFSDLYFAFQKKYKKTACIAKSILAEDFLKSKGFYNVTTAGVGLDTKRFSADIQKSDIIEKLETKKQTENLKYILYIGKIEERRSVLMLIEAFKKAAEKDPSVHLVIVGKGEKEYVKNCFDYIKQNNLSDKITYIESLPNEQVKFAFKMSDIFLLPTQYEIFGMVLLEAMFFGTPVITTENGGSATLIRNGENGIICDSLSSNDWAKAILSITENKNLQKTISQNAENTIKNHFTWDRLADTFIGVYKTVLNGKD